MTHRSTFWTVFSVLSPLLVGAFAYVYVHGYMSATGIQEDILAALTYALMLLAVGFVVKGRSRLLSARGLSAISLVGGVVAFVAYAAMTAS